VKWILINKTFVFRNKNHLCQTSHILSITVAKHFQNFSDHTSFLTSTNSEETQNEIADIKRTVKEAVILQQTEEKDRGNNI
jgi:hypothetical protein